MSKNAGAWKDLERLIAKKMGGQRIYRGGDFSQSAGDIEHEAFSFEAKYGAQVPSTIYRWMDQAKKYTVHTTKIPILVIRRKSKEPLVVMPFSEFYGLFGKKEECNS